ncbi:MAG TPA: carboxylating nicotinate-nucleotide diphosphorylase [Candidatus Paceibacterota bacterium]|nr:carboxylating nicotinate-nucleotide diphosphorylase [Verrucomicrobiota bacterium]HOX01780.1 carboxylating nicotinate-nucleotide diphosphorylase [Verrucomicrobiota bacterium]HRZ44569.1 carboxylating nicotinate-nucleotide diphosphorylase [Candidatus Paceibacterota bacterium]
MTPVLPAGLEPVVRAALAEDVGAGDVTTLAIIPTDRSASARLVARDPLVVAGLEIARLAFLQLDPAVQFQPACADGDKAAAGQALARIDGPARALLTGERVALNFLQRLSGIATLTAQFVAAVAGTRAQILDTRKTTPGWRALEKYAVRCGGGRNHRFGLYDQVLIKDNHLAALRDASPDPVHAAVRLARARYPQLAVEVEADTLDQVRLAASAGADIILLDNMSLEELRAAVQIVDGRARTEASGGVRLDSVRAIAETGVDFISAGALTHSARAADIALDFV